MTEKEKAETKKAPAKKPAAAKAEAKPAARKEAAAAAAEKPAVPKSPKGKAALASTAATGKVKVTQVVGSIARKGDQRATLIGLGLNKRHRSRVLQDTPEIRGMINKVKHLVKVEAA